MGSIIRLVVVSLLMSLLSACVTLKTNVHPDDKLAPKSKTGIVMGSVSQDPSVGIFHTNSSFLIYTADEKEYARVSAREEVFLGIHRDSLFDGYEGQVFAVEFPVGTHVLKKWSVVVGNVIYSPRYPLKPITVTVKPGEVTYIGNLHMKLDKRENLLGMDRSYPKFPVVSDQFSRDLKLFRAKYSNLSQFKVARQVSFTGPWISFVKNKTLASGKSDNK